MADRNVLVRLGWRRTSDGQIPRIPRPGPGGFGVPGDYIGWRKVRGEDGSFQGWELTGTPEIIADSQTVREMIREGHLTVEDPAHPLRALEPPRQEVAETKNTTTNKKGGPRAVPEE